MSVIRLTLRLHLLRRRLGVGVGRERARRGGARRGRGARHLVVELRRRAVAHAADADRAHANQLTKTNYKTKFGSASGQLW